ncbi:MAG: winged helix-turn-helix transcriptional regulator [Candidatus Thermoplasmatota archaeon]|nr:winged helix-turn-helix transcriptional regulator [Candidatus Thermoplasmatota archaeon]MBS3790640.1 winged helix-turn-helix transcriptional regulator [Candidatus Thermoplasmatota archaeon]
MPSEMEIPDEVEQDLQERGGIGELLKKIRDEKIEEQSQIYKALSNKLRLKILTLLDEQELCVCLLKEMLEIKDSKLSYHLSVLKDEGLIEGEREANFVIYRIKEKGKKYAP